MDEKAKVRLLQETGTSPLQPSGYEFTVQGDSGHHDWQVYIWCLVVDAIIIELTCYYRPRQTLNLMRRMRCSLFIKAVMMMRRE